MASIRQQKKMHLELLKIMQVATIAILPARYELDNAGRLVEVEPARPCPELLTAEEAIRYLRLDETEGADPERTLRYYREKWGLRGTQVGRRVRYRRIELDRLLDRLTEDNPR